MKSYTAAAIMARWIVEGVCERHGYKKCVLDARLKKMRDDGVIDSRLYEWADAFRQVGNQGAHSSSTRVSHEDAQEVLAFVEALLDYLFVFRRRYEEFSKRRNLNNPKKI